MSNTRIFVAALSFDGRRPEGGAFVFMDLNYAAAAFRIRLQSGGEQNRGEQG